MTIGKGARIEGAMLFDGAVVEDEARVVALGGRVPARGSSTVPWCTTPWSATGPSSARTASCASGLRVWPDVVLPPHGVRFSAGRLTVFG